MTNFVIIHQLCLKKMLAESGKETQKGDFLLTIAIFRTNLPPEDKVIDWKQPFPGEPQFLFFNFYCNYLAYAKERSLKKACQRLVSYIFDPLGRVIKIMTKFDEWIYTCTVVFCLCDDCVCDWN